MTTILMSLVIFNLNNTLKRKIVSLNVISLLRFSLYLINLYKSNCACSQIMAQWCRKEARKYCLFLQQGIIACKWFHPKFSLPYGWNLMQISSDIQWFIFHGSLAHDLSRIIWRSWFSFLVQSHYSPARNFPWIPSPVYPDAILLWVKCCTFPVAICAASTRSLIISTRSWVCFLAPYWSVDPKQNRSWIRTAWAIIGLFCSLIQLGTIPSSGSSGSSAYHL